MKHMKPTGALNVEFVSSARHLLIVVGFCALAAPGYAGSFSLNHVVPVCGGFQDRFAAYDQLISTACNASNAVPLAGYVETVDALLQSKADELSFAGYVKLSY